MEKQPPLIRLVAIDIDGTLLNPEKQITPRTKAAIKAAQEAGVVVTLATARRYINTSPLASELGVAIPVILCDGALVIQHPDGTVLRTNPLGATIAQRAVDIIARHGLQPVVHHIDGTYEITWTGPLEYDNEWVAPYFSLFPERVCFPFEACCIDNPDPLRVVVFASEAAVTALAPEISTLPCSWYITRKGSYGCAELVVMNASCTKGNGVKALAEYVGVPMEQVMAIGDGNNDLEMLQAVGWGVAMGQAPDFVKEVAHTITASNREDGVAQAIERYVLGRDMEADSNSLKRATCL